MTLPAVGNDRPTVTRLTVAWGVWAFSVLANLAYGGGLAHDGEGLWGEYGHGPHFANHSCRSCDLRYPDFTHGPGCGIPYSGPAGSFSSGAPDYGPYTGAPPYPDTIARSTVAPFGSREAAMLSARSQALGIDEEPVVGTDGVRGLKVVSVHPGTVAEKAELRAGDVIQSINGYRTIQRGNLAWITSHAAPDKVLKMSVRGSNDGKARTVTARLP